MKFEISEDTIIALATPPGIGAISIIRISGPESISAIDKIFSGKMKINDAKSHTIHYGKIIYNNEILDDVLVSVFRAPNTYTAEDCIEISTHGSPLITQRIISLIIDNTRVRPAEPGEFTKRAFLNNRIDLTQAEAVADLINSRTAVSLRGARNQMNGLLFSKIRSLRQQLVDISSIIELELDFSEENIVLFQKSEMIGRIKDILSEIDVLLNSYSFGKVIRDGIHVAIVGAPNVGKSSLLNYLLKESRAIVSDTPGTTRDTISEMISIDGFLFRLHDTAGIRFSVDEIENEGIERARQVVRDADIIFLIGDVIVGFSEFLEEELHTLNSTVRVLKILNKIDLGVNSNYSENFRISAKTGFGINNLLAGLKEVALHGGTYTEKDIIISNIRHFDCLMKVKTCLIKALNTISENYSGEFLASDLRAAEISFSEIIGEITPEDILNNIFSKFCIGK